MGVPDNLAALCIDETATEFNIPAGVDWLQISNARRMSTSAHAFASRLASTDVSGIKHLSIEANSMFKDLEVVAAFPALTALSVHGGQMESLAGIEAHKTYASVNINTGKNVSRTIEAILRPSIDRLAIHCTKRDSLTLEQCSRIGAVALYRAAAELDLRRWQSKVLTSINLHQCQFRAFGFTDAIPTLVRVAVHASGRFERLIGRNPRLQSLLIQVCNRFRFESLSTSMLEELRSLTIVSQRSPIPLLAIGPMRLLRSLHLLNSKLSPETFPALASFPALEEVTIYPASRQQIIAMSVFNGAVRVSNSVLSAFRGVVTRL